MASFARMLTMRRGKSRADLADWLAYLYLALGVLVMFGPVLWLVSSSLKTQAALQEFPPSLLPTGQKQAKVDGFDKPLPLFVIRRADGTTAERAMVRRIGIEGQFVDPGAPSAGIERAPMASAAPARETRPAFENYTVPLKSLSFGRYFTNSLFVTITATLITLVINSMCAFALSKYSFRGRNAIFIFIISTLMIPITVVLVPVFLVVTSLGLSNSLWGVILPPAATPTGVFLLRQYMLTIPDELIDAARMDGASEWRLYWRIILPLTAPALAVLTIFSIMWRWNDFLWPLIVLNREEVFTLQIGLASFQGELTTQWHYLLAMTVVTLIPVVLVFGFLQRYVTAGIASTGIK
ncbi:carbohydrate ABC transporter membrane protein 2, CUT1 family [Rhizobiales bacterium GAS191]|nr:carbohydrate ABC transporter membrane protein 2, CUT1 family [Rhizobiales bacterium GAS191]